MAVDLDTWRPAHPAWSVRLDGYTYRARPVSARAVAQAEGRLAGTSTQQLEAVQELLRLAFPWRWSYVWRGDPVRKIMALERDAFREVVADFFGHLGLHLRWKPQRTHTTASPPSTPFQTTNDAPPAA